VLLHNRAPSNPSVVIRALVRAAASRETPGSYGHASMTGRMLRQGTENITKAALAEELDGMGTGLSVDVGYSLVSISIKCLTDDFPRALQILTELLRRPAFPEDELERLRGQVLTELKEMDDNTRVVCERTWRELAYPSTHPYHRLTVGSEASVAAVTRDDLSAFHTAWYGPNQTTLIVVGDTTLAEMPSNSSTAISATGQARIERVEETLPASDLPPSAARDRHGREDPGRRWIGLPTLDSHPITTRPALPHPRVDDFWVASAKVRTSRAWRTTLFRAAGATGAWLAGARRANPRNLTKRSAASTLC
jgi:zinc protease